MLIGKNKKILLLGGPTASGKTACVLEWARARDGEIINADSMQIYRELRVLTACPSEEEEAVCPHHLFRLLKGDDPCSAERWRELALAEIEEIWQRGKLPVIVGGTGLYFKTLLSGLSPIPDIDPLIRENTREQVREEGADAAHTRLEKLDPATAARLAPGDSQRIGRALEVALSTGKPLSYWQEIPLVGGLEERTDVQIEKHVKQTPREELYARCDKRFRLMVEEGQALAEVKNLVSHGYAPDMPVMKALGVGPLSEYLKGNMGLEAAITLSQTATRQYAKRQMTWFRNQCGDWQVA